MRGSRPYSFLEAVVAAASHRLNATTAAGASPASPGDVLASSDKIKDAIRWFWIIGVGGTLIGASLTVLGFMVQKISHRHSVLAGQPYWQDWRWIFGLLLWLLGQVICWLADGLATRSVLACFNCWNIVIVFALAPICCGEVVDGKAALGALMTVFGCLWVIKAGPRDYHEQTVHSLNKAWQSCLLIFILAATGLYFSMTGLLARVRSSLAQATPFEFAALSASLAWYAVLFSKCVSTLVVTSATGKNQMIYWEFWLFLVCMAICAIGQIHTLNLGLKSGRSLDVLPTYEAVSMTGQIVICGIFFREFRGFDIWGLASFGCGVTCVLVGVVALVRFGQEGDPKEAKEAGDVVDDVDQKHTSLGFGSEEETREAQDVPALEPGSNTRDAVNAAIGDDPTMCKLRQANDNVDSNADSCIDAQVQGSDASSPTDNNWDERTLRIPSPS